MISTYCVTFRIANKIVGGKNYDERRQMLVNNVRTQDVGYWDETTSFFLVNSDLETSEFTKKAVAGLSSADDLVVAFDPHDMSAAYFGPLREEDVLRSFFRSLKKVP